MWGFYKKRAIAGGHWEAASEGLMCRKATWVCSQAVSVCQTVFPWTYRLRFSFSSGHGITGSEETLEI